MTSAPQLFRALADRTRLRIVNLLTRGPLCVCDIRRILGQPQSSVSRHLALLKSAGLILDRRDGMRIFYSLPQWESLLARGVLAAIRAHLAAEGDYGADVEALERLRARGECHEEPEAWGRRSKAGGELFGGVHGRTEGALRLRSQRRPITDGGRAVQRAR
jgi:ArsR family transcriptional regulator, arsenate/arsenite/antimonite-responsive transcriptional repressor